MNILITGATGFIGKNLIENLLKSANHTPFAAIRRDSASFPSGVKTIRVGDLLPETNWQEALTDIDVVIHLAARVHIMNDTANDPRVEFQRVNTEGTLNLAEQAAKAGVKRFIFLSTIKVNGEYTKPEQPFKADDKHIPSDPYALSKYEAEQGLIAIAKKTSMEIVSIRPPLVYGPGVKANFLSMMDWLYKGIPLPLGSIHNYRSLVSLDNLIDLITLCITHPDAANQVFLASDDEDLSTTELLKKMGQALNKPAKLLPVPHNIFCSGLKIIGKGSIAQRLCSSLQVDISQTKRLLDWSPKIDVNEALNKTAQAYLSEKNI